MNRQLPLAALCLTACFNKVEVAVSVFAPDGGDPFVGSDAATQVRATVENGAGGPQVANVSANGAFTLSLDLNPIDRPSRLILEALAGGNVVGSGATPAVIWSRMTTGVIPVFVQRRDSLVPAPPRIALGAPRTAPRIVSLSPPFVAVLGGVEGEAPVDVFDLFNLARPENMNVVRAPYIGAVEAIGLDGSRVLILKGCQTTIWNAGTNTFDSTGENVPPTERCDTTQSTFVADPGGGGYLVGGLRMGAASARVDRVLPSGAWVAGVPLTTPRVAPSAVWLRDRELVVAGGQADATAPALERYALDGSVAMDRRAIRTGDADVDTRTGATLVRAGDAAYLLGGVRAGTTDYAARDAVLDLACLEQSCAVFVGATTLLRSRRRDAVAAVSEGEQVIVAGGVNGSGAVTDVERIDATMPRAPVAAGVIGAVPGSGIAAARVHTGSVLLVGAGQRNAWLFRH